MREIGSHEFALAAGAVPERSHGAEPEFTSHDLLCVLNAADQTANLELTVYHTDRDPVGPYPIRVEARRVRHVRMNDLIEPEAVPLGVPYGCVLRSDVAVVAQMLRQDTRDSGRGAPGITCLPFV
ncbi:sensory rhodopsin transducer [Nocardiopsis metallicus]|uniref:Sensory rhodopsin transducer n=1 Tax=Nocardiopsis metallicus TaxID=179819 RepID=A0A840VYH1_9ACTN|nr:sensory rhodopsin transducer [Nocardiopsis metallicus]MBB5489479.1 hypothetical protein [Nocardiopsis metallicus]